MKKPSQLVPEDQIKDVAKALVMLAKASGIPLVRQAAWVNFMAEKQYLLQLADQDEDQDLTDILI